MIKLELKFLILSCLMFSFSTLKAQVLSFDYGEIEFYTATTLSDIEAFTETAEVKLDSKTGNFEINININSFEFEYDLMKEHFNEKHMESDKFPLASFKGKILQDISKDFNEMDVDASGELNIHGVTKRIEVKAAIFKNNGHTIIKCKIPVVFKDYNVDEPSILTKAVAKSVEVKSTLYLK